jgi:hypothetical protein
VSEDNEPDWSTQLAKGGEALRRQVEPIVKAAEQFVRDARRAKTSGGPALPFAQRVALAVDAGLHELLPSPESLVIDYAVYAQAATAAATAPSPTVNATATLAGEGTVTASGSVALPPMSFSGQGTVEDRRSGLAALSDGQIVFLVLVWLYAFVLPWFGAAVPPEFHAILSDHYATTAIALGITWRIIDKNK